MRGTRAKKLRKFVKKLMDKAPEVVYNTKIHRNPVTGRIAEQRVLMKGCQRKTYKGLKQTFALPRRG